MARSTRAVATANRERVLGEAARKMKERGLNGIGVADLMAAAGLTHGGFYRHFASKEQLAAEAVERAALAGARGWREIGEAARASGKASGLAEIVEAYLCATHREDIVGGCAVAGLGGEIARLPADLRAVAAKGIMEMIDALSCEMPSGDEPERRRRAVVTLSTMLGALILARLGVDGDALSLASESLKTTA